MAVVKDTAIKCDDCGNMDGWSRTAKVARQECKRFGWVRMKGKDYCPSCAPKYKPIKSR